MSNKCKHLNVIYWAFIAECTDCHQKALAFRTHGSISSGKLVRKNDTQAEDSQ